MGRKGEGGGPFTIRSEPPVRLGSKNVAIISLFMDKAVTLKNVW